jgi:hypothetical protein
MTLAVILFASIFCTAPARPAAGATPRQSAQPAPASQPAPAAQTAGEKKDQGTGSTAQSSSPTQPPSSAAAPTQTPSVQKPTIAKHRRKRSGRGFGHRGLHTARHFIQPDLAGSSRRSSYAKPCPYQCPHQLPSIESDCAPGRNLGAHDSTSRRRGRRPGSPAATHCQSIPGGN